MSNDDISRLFGGLQIGTATQITFPDTLIIVAATFMSPGFECVIGWSEARQEFVRPVTTFTTNRSWPVGTFIVGRQYRFKVVSLYPESSLFPHQTEDVLVLPNPAAQTVPVILVEFTAFPGSQMEPVPLQIPKIQPIYYKESRLYHLLYESSVHSIPEVFAPAIIAQNRYIVEGTKCPSVGVLRCLQNEIFFYPYTSVTIGNGVEIRLRCKIQGFDFPVTAQNGNSLFRSRIERPVDDNRKILVLLGLGRPFAGGINNSFTPRRCYILLIGVIHETL